MLTRWRWPGSLQRMVRRRPDVSVVCLCAVAGVFVGFMLPLLDELFEEPPQHHAAKPGAGGQKTHAKCVPLLAAQQPPLPLLLGKDELGGAAGGLRLSGGKLGIGQLGEDGRIESGKPLIVAKLLFGFGELRFEFVVFGVHTPPSVERKDKNEK